ncbi:MAG: PRC-barrel domain-containing protein [Candidatus Coproplasma sp.]
MEFSFCKLKKLDVISVTDGKNLGKFCDVTFTLPDGKIKGFTATGCKGIRFTKSDVFIPLSDIVKVGEDAILVKTGEKNKKGKDDKHDCPPDPCRRCPPPDPCEHFNPCNPCDSRRSFDDYE